MRRTIIAALLGTLVAGIGFSQNIEQGDIIFGGYSNAYLAGGSFEFDYDDAMFEDSDKVETFETGLALWAGYFVLNGLELGFEAFASYYDYEYPGGFLIDEANGYSLSIGPQIGFFGDLGSMFVPFGQVTVFYYQDKDEEDGSVVDEDNGWGFRPRAGVAAFFTDSVALTLDVYARFQRLNDEDSDPSFDLIERDFGVSFGFLVAL